MLGAIVLGIYGRQGPGSIMGGVRPGAGNRARACSGAVFDTVGACRDARTRVVSSDGSTAGRAD